MKLPTGLYARIFLGAAPFVVLLAILWGLALERHVDNPADRLLPLPSQLYAGVLWSLTPGATGAGDDIPILVDTFASLTRLSVGLALSGGLALVLALSIHTIPTVRHLCYPFVVAIAKVPPIALLPILLLWMGVNESSKAALILLGIAPYITLQLTNDLERTGREFADKLSTLNLPLWQRLLYIDTPLIWPSFLHQIQTSLGPAWLFLLVAETVGADAGLGYRIFVVRRYLAMEIILPYVAWIALLSVSIYALFDLCTRRFRWYFQ